MYKFVDSRIYDRGSIRVLPRFPTPLNSSEERTLSDAIMLQMTTVILLCISVVSTALSLLIVELSLGNSLVIPAVGPRICAGLKPDETISTNYFVVLHIPSSCQDMSPRRHSLLQRRMTLSLFV